MRDSYYDAGLEYFNSFDGINEGKVLGVEQSYNFKIEDFDFTGIIDLETDIAIGDHKTKSKQHVTRITKKNCDKDWIQLTDGRYVEFHNFIQLYIYCIPYRIKYDKYPDYLFLNMLRIQDLYKIPFNENQFEKAKQWVTDKIREIYEVSTFVKGNDVGDFWCNFTCGQRENCEYSDRYLGI